MKRILFLLASLPLFAFAQEDDLKIPIDATAHKISYIGVVLAPGQSKEDIYVEAKEWFSKQFALAHANITMDDFGTGHLIGHGNVVGQWLRGVITVNFTLTFNIDIRVKDGKYRYEMTDFSILDGISHDDLSPNWFSTDIFLTPEYMDKNGKFKGKALKQLTSLDGNLNMIIANLKGAIADKDNRHRLQTDF